jgi:hypothetical protein
MMPVLNFAFPKFSSENWTERYVGNIALGAIMEGPNPEYFKSTMDQYYESILNQISDSVPKVKHTVAWVIYRMAQHNPQMIFSSQQSLDTIVNICLQNMFSPHLSISMLLFGSIQCIFKLADQYNIADRLNVHFLNCF